MKTPILLLAALAFASASRADRLELPPSADTTVDATQPDANFGQEPTILLAKEGRVESRALVRFDIAANVPPGSTITGVSLRLEPVGPVDPGSLLRVALHRVRRAWNEGRGTVEGSASAAHETSWNRRLNPGAVWSRAGGAPGADFIARPRARVALPASEPLVIASTPQLVRDVQAWLDQPFSNEGWMLLSNADTAPEGLSLASREDPQRAPRLTIDFTPPSADAAAESAEYVVTFRATWSRTSHPREFPAGAHWSGLVGGLHNREVSFWGRGATASEGIRRMAEVGAQGTLLGEINAAIAAGTANRGLSGEGIARASGRSSLRFTIDRSHSLVTLTSMVAPSPDWFVGVRNLPLFVRGRWVTRKIVPLFPYDAGTDSGVTFESPNEISAPRGVISRIVTPPLASQRGGVRPMGYMDFRRISTSRN